MSKQTDKKEKVRVCIYCNSAVKESTMQPFDYSCKQCKEELLASETKEIVKP